MKNEPWVRLGILSNPKISEKPAESRKRRPPSVMLLMASTNHKFMRHDPSGGFAAAILSWGRPGGGRRGRWGRLCVAPSGAKGRIVARVDGLRQEPLLVVRPELTHVGIRLDGRIDELVTLLLAPADVETADHIAEVVEVERSPRGVGERHRAERLNERLAVVGLPTG